MLAVLFTHDEPLRFDLIRHVGVVADLVEVQIFVNIFARWHQYAGFSQILFASRDFAQFRAHRRQLSRAEVHIRIFTQNGSGSCVLK